LISMRFQSISDNLCFSSAAARWTPVINFYRDSSSFIPLLLVVSLLISSFLDLVILLSLNAVVLVLLNGLSLRCSTGFFLRGLFRNSCLFLSWRQCLLELFVCIVDSFNRLLESCTSFVQSVDRCFLSNSLLWASFLLHGLLRSLGLLLRRLLLGLVLFWLVCTVLFGLLTGLVSLGGSLVCLGIASAFCTALWLLSGASCSFFTCTSLTLVLGLGGLDNVVYKEN